MSRKTFCDVTGAPRCSRVMERQQLPHIAQAMLVGAGGTPLTSDPDAITIADNGNLADNGPTIALVFNIETGAGLLGAAVLANLPRASRFSIPGLIHTLGVGIIQLQYRVSDTGAWQLYESYPLSLNYPIDEVLIPTVQQYRVFYHDINDGAVTTGLDLQVVLYPTPS